MKKANLDEILRDFCTVSGMDISVVDSDFHTLSLTRGAGTTLCTAIHRDPKSIDVCKASDIERLSAARADGAPVLYTCPFGITEAIVPIIRDDEAVGYIISALGVEIGGEYGVISATDGKDEIRHLVSESRKLTREELSAYFNMMKMLADYISDDDSLLCTNRSIGQLIKKYVKNNLAGKLTLKNIARNLHCSTVTLTEHFKAEFGITINEYITKKRMELAERLMLTSDKPLREIAADVGFSDVEYFSRTFKKHHGESPAAWRRKKGDLTDDYTKIPAL